jgi:flagellar biosynthesis/type III secretory pathway protein FliH
MRTSLGGIEHCEVQAERRVSRGGALVRTPDGDVDARIETKLERAREVVEDALSSPPVADTGIPAL